MQNQPTSPTPPQLNLQEYLSLGYLYLVVLGLLSDVIFYKFLGIDILAYASISDVLLAPLNTLFHDVKVLFLFVGALTAVYFFYVRKNTVAPEAGLNLARIQAILSLLLVMLLGLKMGSGYSVRQRVAKGDTPANQIVTFTDDGPQRVKVIGQNSAYLFYVPEGQKQVLICPIGDQVKSIQMIP